MTLIRVLQRGPKGSEAIPYNPTGLSIIYFGFHMKIYSSTESKNVSKFFEAMLTVLARSTNLRKIGDNQYSPFTVRGTLAERK